MDNVAVLNPPNIPVPKPPTNPVLGKWYHVGYVGIDTAYVLISDPAYAGDFAREHFADPECHEVASFESMPGNPMAVAVGTGIGDGRYNVYIKYGDLLKDGSVQISGVKVEFKPFG